MSEMSKPAFSGKLPKIVLFYIFIAALIGLLFFTVSRSVRSYNDSQKRAYAATESHIKTVMTVDRNCNECHLGASFVNLFSHEAVKSNDNVVIFIMNKTNIKRW